MNSWFLRIKDLVLFVTSLFTISTVAETVSYTYDSGNRLIGAEYGSQSIVSYRYDPASNISNYDVVGCDGSDNQFISISSQWNIMSTNVMDCRTVEEIKNDWGLVSLWVYDSERNTYFHPEELSNHILPGVGIWAYSYNSNTLIATGEEIDYSIQLQKGWNMIGAPSVTISVDDLAKETGSNRVWYYNGSTYYLASQMYPGKGYWVYSLFEGDLSVDVSIPGSPIITFLSYTDTIVQSGARSVAREDADGDNVSNIEEVDIFETIDDFDSDGDAMSNQWETANGFDPNNAADTSLDPDGDGLTNLEEYVWGTNPNSLDSDSDNTNDYDDIGLHYTVNPAEYSWLDINSDGTSITNWTGGSNNGYALVPIGFDYSHFDNSYNQVYISNNGLILFENASTVYSNQNIPYNGSPNNLIAAFWDDLNLSHNTQAKVLYHTQGTPGSRKFIVTYNLCLPL